MHKLICEEIELNDDNYDHDHDGDEEVWCQQRYWLKLLEWLLDSASEKFDHNDELEGGSEKGSISSWFGVLVK